MKRSLQLLALLPACFLSFAAAASIILVPQDQPTIQAGIDAAAPGDTVLVADGTYIGEGNRDLDFGGKAIIVRSENGPTACIIDCGGSETEPHRGFYFHAGEGSDAEAQGFTIRNGYIGHSWSGEGGGISCIDSSPTLLNNIIQDNHADEFGCGIYCSGSAAIIVGNSISGNSTTSSESSEGGGICCSASSLTIIDNLISGNFCTWRGGGIACFDSTGIIEGNSITFNDGGGYGSGGIYCSGSSPIISHNLIAWNTASEFGGGIGCMWNSSPLITGNVIEGNESYYGAGISLWTASSSSITNNIIIRNKGSYGGGLYCVGPCSVTNNALTNNSAFRGGGICCYVSDAVIINNTMVSNESYEGGALFITNGSSAVVRNSILWGNEAGFGKEICISDHSRLPAGLEISYSAVEGGIGSVLVKPGCELNWGGGMLYSDPLFISGPDGFGYLEQIAAGQAADSPCRNAGGDLGGDVCFATVDEYGLVLEACLDDYTTRIDQVDDSGAVDMGYHHGSGLVVPPASIVGAELTCLPDWGVLPFSTMISARLTNQDSQQTRRLSGRIDVTLAGGSFFSNWRSGYTNLSAFTSFITSWNQFLPQLGSLQGNNIFQFLAEDVTPSPWNQPPYAPSGDTDTSACTVTGIVP